jgi:hypothetical protein
MKITKFPICRRGNHILFLMLVSVLFKYPGYWKLNTFLLWNSQVFIVENVILKMSTQFCNFTEGITIRYTSVTWDITSSDSSEPIYAEGAGIAQLLGTGYGLDGPRSIPGSARFFTSPQPHPAFYPMGAGGSFPGAKTAGAWSWPHHLVPRSRIRGSIHPPPHLSSWRSAQLVKNRDSFTFTFTSAYAEH